MFRLGHLNITVNDLDKATAFYCRWFGFDRILAEYPDGTRFLTDASGFELGLHHGSRRPERATDWHFGFLAPNGQGVRDLMASLLSDGVPVLEPEDEPEHVGFKCLDPDDHIIEIYWEPRA